MSRSVVSLVRTADRRRGVGAVFGLLDPYLKAAEHVAVVCDLGCAEDPPGSTHVETLYQVVMETRQRGAGEILLPARARQGSTAEVLAAKGIHRLADELGVTLLDLDKVPPESFEHFTHERLHWRDGFKIARIARESDFLVFVGGLKTAAGGSLNALSLWTATSLLTRSGAGSADELRTSPHQREMIAEVNLACHPALIVMDGVDALIEGGPDTGRKKRCDVMLGGTDRVAIDVVGAMLLEMAGRSGGGASRPTFEHGQIKRAMDLGIGISSVDDIELRTDGGGESGRLARDLRARLDSRE